MGATDSTGRKGASQRGTSEERTGPGLLGSVKGFGVTFAHMFRRVVTTKYPFEHPVAAPRYHGRHILNRHPDGLEKCIGCELCAWACPADAIYVEGANNTGHDSLLVLTGVTGLAELVAAPPALRPTYLSADLGGLGAPHPQVEHDGSGGARCGGWRASVDGGSLTVIGDGSLEDWWRAAAVAAWRHLDTTGTPCSADGVSTPSTVSP